MRSIILFAVVLMLGGCATVPQRFIAAATEEKMSKKLFDRPNGDDLYHCYGKTLGEASHEIDQLYMQEIAAISTTIDENTDNKKIMEAYAEAYIKTLERYQQSAKIDDKKDTLRCYRIREKIAKELAPGLRAKIASAQVTQ